MSKYVRFNVLPQEKGRVTKRFEVTNGAGDIVLGHIGWHSPWRRYVFYPQANTLFDSDCVQEIASHLHSYTLSRKMQVEESKTAKRVIVE